MKKRAVEVVEQQCGLLVSNKVLSISQEACPLNTNTPTRTQKTEKWDPLKCNSITNPETKDKIA